MGEVGDVKAGEGVDSVGEELGMLVGVVEVGDGGVDVAGAAGAQVGGHGCEFLGVASDEEEARALRGPDAAGGFGDAGGGAEDEDLAGRLVWRGALPGCAHRPGLSPVTRSQKVEVSRGSRKRANCCHCG